jgi:hypothetical protein
VSNWRTKADQDLTAQDIREMRAAASTAEATLDAVHMWRDELQRSLGGWDGDVAAKLSEILGDTP